jgi:hypothetical protein
MYEIQKQHILAGWAFVSGCIDFDKKFAEDMERAGMDETDIRKILLNVRLLDIPRKNWTTTNEWHLSCIISYIIFYLAHNQDVMDKILYEMDKRSKAEVSTNELTSEGYMRYRKTQFELKRIVKYAWDKRSDCEMTFSENGTITIS